MVVVVVVAARGAVMLKLLNVTVMATGRSMMSGTVVLECVKRVMAVVAVAAPRVATAALFLGVQVHDLGVLELAGVVVRTRRRCVVFVVYGLDLGILQLAGVHGRHGRARRGHGG